MLIVFDVTTMSHANRILFHKTIVQIARERHGSVRQNICSDGKFSWQENRADISLVDSTCLILFHIWCFTQVENSSKIYHMIEQ